jgi:1,4-alpha-glucan branching enzyme
MILTQAGSEPGTVLVTFQFPGSLWLNSVHLVGDFNQWNQHNLSMGRRLHNPGWQITLDLERGKAYQFRYLVNGTTWCNDADADRYVPNPFGSYNCVVETRPAAFEAGVQS